VRRRGGPARWRERRVQWLPLVDHLRGVIKQRRGQKARSVVARDRLRALGVLTQGVEKLPARVERLDAAFGLLQILRQGAQQ